jgi:hypothetical protein
VAALFSQLTKEAAAAVIDAEEGPIHGPAVSPAITDWYELAVVYSSEANPSQASAAATIDSDPGPIYIRPELTSGGNNAKSTAAA